jgi:hypothetical protein
MPYDQRLALDEVEAHVEVVRHAMLEVAVHVDLFHILEAGQQAVAEHADPLAFHGHLLARDTKRLAHADDLVRGQCSGAEALLVPAAVHLRFEPHARLLRM